MTQQTPDRWKNREAEYATIGSCLRDNGCIGEVFQIVKPDDFWFPVCRVVAPIILELFTDNKPVDLVILAERIFREKQHQDAPPVALAELWDAAPTAANALYYAKIVAENALKRNLESSLTELLQAVKDESGSPDEILQQCETEIFQLAQRRADQSTQTIKQALSTQADRYERIVTGQALAGLETGFTEIDSLITGMQAEELIILAARPSIGKTALACQIIRNVTQAGGVAYFASLEQPAHQIAERMLCQTGLIHAQRLRSGKLETAEYERLIDAREKLAQWKIFFSDSPSQSVLQIATNGRRHKLQDDINLIVVDYLQLVQPENVKVSREEQVSTITQRLKNLARELRLPILTLCQVNRQSESRPDRRPRLSDLRESGGIEAHADTVLLLHRNTEDARGQVIDVLVEKNRNGPTGEVSLIYTKEHLLFSEASEAYGWRG